MVQRRRFGCRCHPVAARKLLIAHAIGRVMEGGLRTALFTWSRRSCQNSTTLALPSSGAFPMALNKPAKKHSLEVRQQLASWIRTSRLELNLTQDKLAEILGLSTNALKGYEYGSFFPQDPATIQKLEQTFGNKFEPVSDETLTIHAAKARLSRAYGVPVSAIQIIVGSGFGLSTAAPPLTIEDAKLALGRTYGVPASMIQITVPRVSASAKPRK
jgi:transcriptional regulator with XRE-family HTH domain